MRTEAGAASSAPLLEIHALSKRFNRRRRGQALRRGDLVALDGVSFRLHRGEIFGLAGESGSGKSTLGRMIVRLIEPTSGKVLYQGRDLARLDGPALRQARRRIQIIFQDPATALSPRRSIAQTLEEPLRHFRIGNPSERAQRLCETLDMVGLDPSALGRYPHQFSSGQRQRIAIARALICEPDVVVADEAVSALDVSIQAQIIALLRRIRDERGIAILFISHDLAVIRQLADTVGVMYRGRLVERAPADRLFTTPAHPYTHQLLAAVPTLDPARVTARTSGRPTLSGSEPVQGCVFRARCPDAMDVCKTRAPAPRELPGVRGHRVECHLYAESEQTPPETDHRIPDDT